MCASPSYPTGGADAEAYVTDTQLSRLTRVTTAIRDDITSAWSPDGTRLAFISNRDLNKELCVANADGTGQKRLTTDPGWDATPEWSPDGKAIAFASLRNGRRDIYTIHPDSTSLTRLTTDEATPPSESSPSPATAATEPTATPEESPTPVVS